MQPAEVTEDGLWEAVGAKKTQKIYEGVGDCQNQLTRVAIRAGLRKAAPSRYPWPGQGPHLARQAGSCTRRQLCPGGA